MLGKRESFPLRTKEALAERDRKVVEGASRKERRSTQYKLG